MTDKKIASTVLRYAASIAVLLIFAALQAGCGSTCDRVEKDRQSFLARQGTNRDTHVEVLIPFVVIEQLVEPHIAAVKPIDVEIPDLGSLSGYIGDLSIAPTRFELRPATLEHIGFRLHFEVRSNGNRAFAMYLDTEIRPQIDLAAGKITVGLSPDVLKKTKPGISEEAKKDFGGMLYAQIPAVARVLISRPMVDTAAGTAIDMLISGFYEKAKETMLPKLAQMSQFEFILPNIPLSKVAISSTASNGGQWRLAIATSLPVRNGIAGSVKNTGALSKKLIAIRMSGSTVAELVNWAIAKGLLPERYDNKGKPKPDGEFYAGLDWVRGDERPMKVFLWDLEKPCMRLTMSARPEVKITGDELDIDAADIKTDDVEASAFTKVGVWFSLLWKDALKLKKKTSSKMKLTVAGQEIEIAADRVAIEQDDLSLKVRLDVANGH